MVFHSITLRVELKNACKLPGTFEKVLTESVSYTVRDSGDSKTSRTQFLTPKD